MSRKTLSTWAIVMVIVFGGMVVLYPLLFNPEHNSSTESDAPMTPPTMPEPPAPTLPPVK